MNIVVGGVGLGIMGGAMAGNLMAGGFTVVGYDPDAGAMAAFTERGGEAAANATEVAERADIVITSLPSAAAFLSTAEDLAKAGKAGVIVVETSTLPIADKEAGRAVAEAAGLVMLDCPLSGTGHQARGKDLMVFASGDRAAYEKCIPVFEGFGRSHVHVGEFGNGSKMKFVANHLINVLNVACAEALVLGIKAGLEPGTVFDVIKNSAANSRMWEIRGPLMAKGDYGDPGMKIQVWQKDLKVIGEYAASIGCPTPLFAMASQPYYAALSQGLGGEDTAAVAEVLKREAGLK
jgi:putative dehydrogenase